MKIRVPGKPQALQRHRHFKGGTFDPQTIEKKRYAFHVFSLLRGKYRQPEAICVSITYCFHPPKSWSKKKREAALGTPKLSTPDLSNLIKFTEDSLNGILWKDDRLINRIHAEKQYDEWEGTIIEITDGGTSEGNL